MIKSLLYLVKAVKRESSEEIEIMTEESPVGEHASNAEVELSLIHISDPRDRG